MTLVFSEQFFLRTPLNGCFCIYLIRKRKRDIINTELIDLKIRDIASFIGILTPTFSANRLGPPIIEPL